MMRWHLVRTLRWKESDAQEAIRDGLGFECYLPLEKRLARHGHKRIVVNAPLFSQYLFTRFDVDADPWWKIRRPCWSWLIDDLVLANGHPAWIPDKQIDIVRRAEQANLFNRMSHIDEFAKGTKVRIMSGATAGIIARINRASPSERVEILFQLMGREIKANIPKKDLAIVK